MNKTELAQLLTMVSTFDSRTVGIDTVEAWYPIMQDIDVHEALKVVQNHFATSNEYLMPAHITRGVQSLSGPKRLASDVLNYCQHWWPVGECDRCNEEAQHG